MLGSRPFDRLPTSDTIFDGFSALSVRAGNIGRHADVSVCVRMRFWTARPHLIDAHNSPHQHNPHNPRTSAFSSCCRVPGSAQTGSQDHALERQRRGNGRRRGGSGDRRTDTGDDDGGGGVDERGVVCASRAQKRVSVLHSHERPAHV